MIPITEGNKSAKSTTRNTSKAGNYAPAFLVMGQDIMIQMAALPVKDVSLPVLEKNVTNQTRTKTRTKASIKFCF